METRKRLDGEHDETDWKNSRVIYAIGITEEDWIEYRPQGNCQKIITQLKEHQVLAWIKSD